MLSIGGHFWGAMRPKFPTDKGPIILMYEVAYFDEHLLLFIISIYCGKLLLQDRPVDS